MFPKEKGDCFIVDVVLLWITHTVNRRINGYSITKDCLLY